MKKGCFRALLTLSLSLSVITILICDLRNPMMNFLSNHLTRGYLLVLCLLASAQSIGLLGAALRKKSDHEKKKQ